MSDTKLYRRATGRDSWDWWQIRNDPEALFWSSNKHPIPLAEHDHWYSRVLRHGDHTLVVHDTDGLADAYGRIQREIQAEVSFGVAAPARRRGLGGGMLQALETEASSQGVQRLVAYVHPSNEASMRAFMRQGYVLGGNPGFVRLDKTL